MLEDSEPELHRLAARLAGDAGIAAAAGPLVGLVASLVDPNAILAEGFGPVSSMLRPAEVRDVVEYLATLR